MPVAAVLSPPGRFAQAGVLALTIGVFGAVVGVVTWQLRAGLREQILRKEADTVAAVTTMQLDNRAAEIGDLSLSAVPGELLVQVLKISKLHGVTGVRVFDARRAVSSSFGLLESAAPPADADWAQVAAGNIVVRFHRTLPGEDFFLLPPAADNAGWIETWVPLHRSDAPTALLGAAQVWIDAESAIADLREHDVRLWTQAAIAWIGGSLVIGAALGWAFRRLAAANRELQARGDDLERANRELVLAAKTSALGAVTAHLMHELKNPLAGLESIMAGQADAGGAGGDELAAASALTRRLRTMVNDVVGVLRDEQHGAAFELTGAEIVEIVTDKIRADAAARGVRVEARGDANLALPGRRANLAVLVLRNLVQNAIEATPAGGAVRISALAADGRAVEFRVEDGGGGLPAAVRARLFQPCTSTKVGGSGLGLALSHQLAQQAGGRLELVRSDERGTSFCLVLSIEG